MKILLDCHTSFALAHGGAQIQIEQTKAGLEKVGLEVEYLRWWDAAQKGDVIHFIGRAHPHLVDLAHEKGVKYVMCELLSAQNSRTPSQLRAQRMLTRFLEIVLPRTFRTAFRWESYRTVDACIANTEVEARLMEYMFSAPASRVHVVPNGVEDVFFDSPPVPREDWLVCTGTITPRKRVLELAEAAVIAKTPLWIIGKPYGENEPYYANFLALARANPGIIKYEGGIGDRKQLAEIYRRARGFVLLSTMETRSLSSEEAAACECPLLLTDLPWARDVFGDTASYCPVTQDAAVIAARLAEFHKNAASLPKPATPCRWPEVGQRLKEIYEAIP